MRERLYFRGGPISSATAPSSSARFTGLAQGARRAGADRVLGAGALAGAEVAGDRDQPQPGVLLRIQRIASAPQGPGIHMSLTTSAGARSSAAQAELQSVALCTG